MAVQIPHCLHPEIPASNALWRSAPGTWPGVPASGRAKGMHHRGGAHFARSRAYAREHPTEAGGCQRGGLAQGQKRDPRRATLLEARTQLRWTTSVGEEILRGYGGQGHGENPALHPATGGRRSATRPTRINRSAAYNRTKAELTHNNN